MTQAKKHRNDIEKAREFYRDPRKHGEHSERVKSLKMKLPCARCGKLGHWKDDPECKQRPSAAHMVSCIFVAETGVGMWLILVDTACAESVAGEAWLQMATEYLKGRYGYQLQVVEDREPFRFGPGPVIHSSKAALLPMEWDGHGAVLRISIVAGDVPPLLSRPALGYLQANICMGGGKIKLGIAPVGEGA